jgi:hypothetical protein
MQRFQESPSAAQSGLILEWSKAALWKPRSMPEPIEQSIWPSRTYKNRAYTIDSSTIAL